MATGYIDHEQRFMLKQAESVLKKYGADDIYVSTNAPGLSCKFMLSVRAGDKLYESMGDSLPKLVEGTVKQLKADCEGV